MTRLSLTEQDICIPAILASPTFPVMQSSSALRCLRRVILRPPLRPLHLAPPFIVEDYRPVAQDSLATGALQEKNRRAWEHMRECRLCPRDCGVDRTRDVRGACNTGLKAVVSSAFPHYGEESVLQGWNGSGTIFFSLCNLRCVFCQNWDISQRKQGWELDAEGIADLMMKLQDETKCHNVNFVTPEHVVPQVVEAILVAAKKGFK